MMDHIFRLIEKAPPAKEIFERIARFQEMLQLSNIDYAIIIQNVNVYYFTATTQRSYLILPADKDPIFLVQKDQKRAKEESPLPVIEIPSLKYLPNFISDFGLESKQSVGLELEVLPVNLFNKLKKIIGEKNYVDISNELLKIRATKSLYELDQIKNSGRIIEHVFPKVPDYLKEGISEIELSAALQAEGRRIGHQEIMRMSGFNQETTNPHVLSGANGAISSFGDFPLCGLGVTPAIAQGASRKKIEQNEPIIIDYGGGFNGYITDETRMYVLGSLDASMQKAYAVCLELLQFIEQNACSKANGKEIFEQVEALVKRYGLLENFMGYGRNRVSFIAHGIGLTLNELPIIAKNRDEILKSNMVFAVEPKFVFPDKGAVGAEVDYIVKKEKAERVTTYSTEIHYLRK